MRGRLVTASPLLPLGLEPWSGAAFSPCRRYRYRLWRRWREGNNVWLWVCLNPSNAGAWDNDPSVRRMIGFSRDGGADGLELVNEFGLVSTDPKGLLSVDDPIGPDNDRAIVEAAKRCSRIIASWGVNGGLRGRDQQVLRLLRGRDVCSLGMPTTEGFPRHPLYLPAITRPMLWRAGT